MMEWCYVNFELWGCCAGELTSPEEMQEVLRKVVDKYFEHMSEGTLYVLAGYSQAAFSQGHDHVGGE